MRLCLDNFIITLFFLVVLLNCLLCFCFLLYGLLYGFFRFGRCLLRLSNRLLGSRLLRCLFLLLKYRAWSMSVRII